MATLLVVNSSPKTNSVSRKLTQKFVEDWKVQVPKGTVVHRDLANAGLPFLNEAWIAAAYTPVAQRTAEQRQLLALSDTLIDEVLLADVIVLGIPAIVVLSHGLAVFGTASIQHGNIRLPGWLERWLQPVLVTVDMHRTHHSIQFSRANWNYGAVLSVWDRFFGSYKQLTRAQHQKIVFCRRLPYVF